MEAIDSLRARLSLGIAVAAVLVAIGALALALRAARERDPARRLRDDDLAVVESVAEARTLVLRLQLAVAAAAAWPADPAPAERFRADTARLADELQRVRLHARDRAVTDVVDDLENAVLRYRTGAEGVFAAAAAGRGEEVRARAAALEQAESAGLREFTEELATLAATRARERAERVRPGGRVWALLALAAGALVLAADAALTAFTQSTARRPAWLTVASRLGSGRPAGWAPLHLLRSTAAAPRESAEATIPPDESPPGPVDSPETVAAHPPGEGEGATKGLSPAGGTSPADAA
jgi:hypothetical protein